MNSFEGHPIIISEKRYQELVEKEKKHDQILGEYPELKEGQKLTPAAKRYKSALASLANQVEKVMGSEEMKGILQVAFLHGFQYSGPGFGEEMAKVNKLLGKK